MALRETIDSWYGMLKEPRRHFPLDVDQRDRNSWAVDCAELVKQR